MIGMSTPADSITRHVAEHISQSQWSALPQDVAAHALRSWVNFVGCAAGGSQHEAVERAERALCRSGDRGLSTVIGRSTLANAQLSALLNGISASVYAFDDTHAQAMVHSSSIVGSALIGLAGTQPAVDGKTLLLSFAWGIELMCRLSKAISVAPARSDIGWSQSGITGAIGAAAACSKLMALDGTGTATAIGLAAAQSLGLRVAHGTMGMHLVPAQAASIGLQSALLAQSGFSGPTHALEGRNGFFHLFCEQAQPTSLTDGLGERFELLSNTFKAYPCGIVIHAVIDACLALRSRADLNVGQMVSIELNVPAPSAALADRQHPATEFEAQVSAQHWAAAALLTGAAGIEQGTQACIDLPAVRALRERCTVKVMAHMPDDASEVRVQMADGQVLVCRVDHYQGGIANPLSDEAIDSKFLNQASRALGAVQARKLLAQCRSLTGYTDVAGLWREQSI